MLDTAVETIYAATTKSFGFRVIRSTIEAVKVSATECETVLKSAYLVLIGPCMDAKNLVDAHGQFATIGRRAPTIIQILVSHNNPWLYVTAANHSWLLI